MNKLRRELNEMLSQTETNRPAALRRSLKEDYLYATDLPQATGGKETIAFRLRAEEAGWRTAEDEGWIQLDLPGALPADAGFRGPYGKEAMACASLLRRHPGERVPGDKERRILTKAGEEGPGAFEKACAKLHTEWAAALRKREPLPEIPDHIFTEEKI